MSKQSNRTAVILLNLGTPDEPTASAVRRYLRQFLSDTRVIEIPMFIWKIILNLFVLPSRSKRVALAYKEIWGVGGDTDEKADSPIRHLINKQASLLQQRIDARVGEGQVVVTRAMTYGNPSITHTFDQLQAEGVEQFIILPLFPQYSSTSTGAAYDAISQWTKSRRNLPGITIIKDYYNHPAYIRALAESVRAFQAEHGKPQKLLMSFHGIPQPYADKGDPYADRCRQTAKLLADRLGLHDEEWQCSFQSRFGAQEWVKPYTDVTLEEWGKAGVDSVQVISPAFSADCLETLEELAVENRDNFLNAGGKHYDYIPALNVDAAHIDLMAAITLPLIDAWGKIDVSV